MLSNRVNKIKLVSRASTKEYSIIATIKLDLYNTLWFFLWYDDWYISPIFFGYDAYKKEILKTYVFNIKTMFVTKIEILYTDSNYKICHNLNLYMAKFELKYKIDAADRYEVV